MVAKIIEYCARNRFLVLILTSFLIMGGIWAISSIRLDAIPDLSDVQVIVYAEFPEQAPQVVEDQVTYPLTTALVSVPNSKVVRGYSFFGISFVYVIFEDGTDLYWARSRVLEYLNYVSSRLPAGVTPRIGPDATGVGWVYEYSLRNGYYCPDHPNGMYHDPAKPDQWYSTPAEAPIAIRDKLEHVRIFDKPGKCPWDGGKELKLAEYDLSELRSLQDWYLRYELTSVDGVSEVASLGGFVRQYQVVIDPVRLQAYNISLNDVKNAIQQSNNDVGGSVLEMSETEYMIRALGYLGRITPEQIQKAHQSGIPLSRVRSQQAIEDLKKIAIRASKTGTPVYLADVADVQLGPEIRRGIAEANGNGEVASGIIVMRFGENANKVIRDVKNKLNELKSGLPAGVDIVSEYDRSGLIERSVATLTDALLQEMLIVGLVSIILLLHGRSELVAIFVVPTGVLVSFIIMHLLGINANIMSLGGIALAIGVMVDSSIVMVENAHKHLDREEERLHREREEGRNPIPRPRSELIIDAAKEVGPTLFFSLLIITVSFLPVFVLGEQSGRMFKPLAYTKTFAIAAGSLLAITIIPVLMIYLITARVLPKEWGWKKNLALTLLAMFVPALTILMIPLGQYEPYKTWIAIGWAILIGMLLVPQKIVHEQANPLSKLMQRVYHPFFILVMKFRWVTLTLALLIVISSFVPLFGIRSFPLVGPWLGNKYPSLAEKFPGLGREFMPPLEEGDLLYMPTTDPTISITKAKEILQQTDKLIASFPEVKGVFGKVGRADTATDPAPLDMLETTIMLETDPAKWRKKHVERWFDFLPSWAKKYSILDYFWPNEVRINVDDLINGYHEGDKFVPGLNTVINFPGLTNAWTQPIRTRIDMLSTGIKTPVGIKIMGDDLDVLSDLAAKIAVEVGQVPGTLSQFPDRSVGSYYLDFEINRDEIARYGLRMNDVQEVILSALGGMNITNTVEGLERYPVNLRYKRELRDNIPALKRTLVMTPSGAQIPLAQLAKINIHKGPGSIKSENSRKTAWVYVDLKTTDIGGWIQQAKQRVSQNVKLPAGYNIIWSGQYEYMETAAKRLKIVVPLTLVLVVLLLYMSTRSWFSTIVILLAVPFSLVGAVWILYLLNYNISLAVVIGMIALAGVDAETGQVMLLYLENSFDRFKAMGKMNNFQDLWNAVHDGAVMRIRPKFMTVATDFIGLLPLMWAVGTGADTMRRLAAPMVGGILTSFIMELLIYPVIFLIAKNFTLKFNKPMALG